MPVDERRRHALHDQVVAAWGEEAAATLFDLLPAPGEEPLSRTYVDRRFDAIDRRFDAIDRRFDAIDQRFEAIDQRFEAMDQRFEAMDQRFEAMDQRFDAQDVRLTEQFENLENRLGMRFERRIADAVTTQTRTLVFSQLGAVVTIAALAFGLR